MPDVPDMPGAGDAAGRQARSLAEPSFYRATAGNESWPSLQGVADADVCIIGGGFAGLATAASLMEKGRRNVVVLEAETVGHGASGRNGGFVFGGYSPGERALAAALCGDVADLSRFGQWGLPATGGPAGLLAAQLTYWYDELRDWMRQ
jgi:glycine/D-amino acid oxidase-like deaminating enzyme